MKKNIYLTVLVIITIFCLVFGVLYHVMGVFNKEEIATEIDIAATDKTIAGATVESIRADMDMGSLTVRTGEELHITYKGKEKYKPSVTVENGTLVIQQKVGRSISFGFNNGVEADLTVILPKDTELSNMEAEIDLGMLELDEVSVHSGSLRADMGDINIENCSLGNMTIEMDAGDLDVRQCDFELLDIRQDMGDVDISATHGLEKADIDMSVSLGSLSVNGRDYGTSFAQKGDGSVTLRVSNDMGDVNLNY